MRPIEERIVIGALAVIVAAHAAILITLVAGWL